MDVCFGNPARRAQEDSEEIPKNLTGKGECEDKGTLVAALPAPGPLVPARTPTREGDRLPPATERAPEGDRRAGLWLQAAPLVKECSPPDGNRTPPQARLISSQVPIHPSLPLVPLQLQSRHTLIHWHLIHICSPAELSRGQSVHVHHCVPGTLGPAFPSRQLFVQLVSRNVIHVT